MDFKGSRSSRCKRTAAVSRARRAAIKEPPNRRAPTPTEVYVMEKLVRGYVRGGGRQNCLKATADGETGLQAQLELIKEVAGLPMNDNCRTRTRKGNVFSCCRLADHHCPLLSKPNIPPVGTGEAFTGSSSSLTNQGKEGKIEAER